MARLPRQYNEASMYHIMVQGIEKRDIFLKEEYKEKYIEILEKLAQEENIKILCYCIMDNHVHIMIYEEELKKVSNFMKRIGICYARYYNNMENRVGYVFRDRFRSEPIVDEKHMLACIRYIHNNPLKAGIVLKASEYRWSSYQSILGEKKCIVDRDWILKLFSNNGEAALKEFIEFSNKQDDQKFMDTKNSDDSDRIDEDIKVIIARFETKYKKNYEELKKDKKIFKILVKEINGKTEISLRKISLFLGINRETIRRLLR